MSKMQTFKKLWENDHREIFVAIYNHIVHTGILNFLSDKTFLKLTYKIKIGRTLNLESPQTFNEKLQWLKLYDRNPRYTELVDKIEVKKYVSNLIGDEYIIPTLGTWPSAEEIDFNSLPDSFVLKCSHDSGSIVICKDKSDFDFESAKRKLNKGLKRNLFYWGREWPYKNVPPRILAEQYMSNNPAPLPDNLKIESCDKSRIEEFNELKDGLTDYKIYCFNGEAKLIMVASNRFSDEQTRFDYFDRDGKWLDLVWGNPRSETEPHIEANIEELFKTAEKLATGIPHVRVDLYYSNGQIYFGEMTFYDASGFGKIESEGWDEMLGDWIELPISAGGGTR